MINKLTSIIINTRNGHQTINRAIRSALDQSFNNIEIIVYDNASDPPINSVIEVVSNKLEIVRCNEALNLGEARNRAFTASSGEYIVFLDDDDIMLPNKIDICIKAMKADSNVGMVYTNVYVYHQQAKRSYLEYNAEMPEGDIYNLLFKGNYILWQSTFFRRESMLGNEDPFPSKFNNVTDFSLYLKILRNWRVKYINIPLSIYILHGSNYSVNHNQAYEELINLSNHSDFNDEEKKLLVNYAFVKKASKSIEMKERKKLLHLLLILPFTKAKIRLLIGYFISFIIDIKRIRSLLIRMKKNKYSEICHIIDSYEISSSHNNKLNLEGRN